MVVQQLLTYLNEIGTAYPNLSFFLTLAFFGWLGNTIMTQYLMQKQIRHAPSKIVFLITFSCALSLLSMYLFEIMKFPIDEYYWYIVLIILVLMCELIIPLCLIFRSPLSSFKITIRSVEVPLLAVFGCGGYVFFLIKTVESRWRESGKQQFQLKILIELGVYYGVYLMALMSAYGAIWCPYMYYNLINQKQRRRITYAKKIIQDEILFIIDQIKIHKYKLLVINQQLQEVTNELTVMKNTTSTVSKMFQFIKGSLGQQDQRQQKIEQLEKDKEHHHNELETLKITHQGKFQKYRDLMEEERRHTVSETLYGKLFRKFSFVLAAYSVTRIVLTIINTIRGRSTSTDPITRLVNFLKYTTDKDFGATFQYATQYISFIFMGYLMITSVRSFSMNFKNFLDYILRRRRLNRLDSATQIYLFSLVYGVYFLAAVILQQSGLPRAYTTTFEQLTKTSNFDLVKHFVLFDWLFMTMCFFSICLLLFTEFQRGGKLKEIIQPKMMD